ncbi:hypothetical protein IE81DRAFT_347534 [Ceraceosorus guamensis]|uniref:Uncharacterized protein n=1 Tax=Ceraceosorus guamensis TaxID=1522189 RepID=A0A316W3V5_9BASI|nr:hypothetical protein IE81DRAFT_347534 [Ceraceosorus guamensis]PWN42275.1 hypothetical protein IE81DRAFT_347534 [Ceraceosorus guamensis]
MTYQLDIIPSYSLGPFVLGRTLHSTLEYLRSRPRQHPVFEITHGATEKCVSEPGAQAQIPNPPSATSALASLPVLVSVPAGSSGATIHLSFSASAQRLQLVVLRMPATVEADDRQTGSSAQHVESFSLVALPLTCDGRTLPSLTRANVHRMFGPTWPAKLRTPTDGLTNRVQSRVGKGAATKAQEVTVRYPGLAFGWDVDASLGHPEPPAQASASRLYVYQGLDPHDPDAIDAPIPARPRTGSGVLSHQDKTPSDQDAASRDSVTMLRASVQSDQPVKITLSTGASVELILNETTEQDLLCDLGTPNARSLAQDERLGIQSSHANRGMFYNYTSLGIDALVSAATSTSSGVLTKIIFHSNNPGTAAFGRYERCPWVVRTARGDSTVTEPFARLHAILSGNAHESSAKGLRPDPSDVVNVKTQPDETMELDRGANPELEGLRLDVRSTLVGFTFGSGENDKRECEGLIVEVDRSGLVSSLTLAGPAVF